MNNYKHTLSRSPQSGFSLIELLVGLVIGLLVTLVIMQVFSVFEGQKRTTTGASDAQTSGSIALYTITRDAQSAGFGLMSGNTTSAILCTTLNFGTTGIADIAPVTITDGGAGSDSIVIRSANSPMGGMLADILNAPAAGSSVVPVSNNLGCRKGGLAVVVNGLTCDFTEVTGPESIAIPPAGPMIYNSVTLRDIPAGLGSGRTKLACLGNWSETTYSVNTANVYPYLERNGSPNMPDIVNLQAQYGVSNACSSNQINQWVNASDPAWTPVALAASINDRNRIKAIRVAVVARNGLQERDILTTACKTAKGTVNNGPCAWDDSSVPNAAPAINLSPGWEYYRYRVFESIIPLRNPIWLSKTCTP